jgi:hypothetical protein
MRYLLFAGLLLAAAENVPAQEKRITYDENVVAIFKEHCIACHNQDKRKGGLRLDNYTAFMQGGSSGSIVKPGDPDGSHLYKVMAHTVEPFMPPNSPTLPPDKLAIIHKWIAGGAPENAGSKVSIPNRPKTEIALSKVERGKPAVPPMPTKVLPMDPVVRTSRGTAVTALAANPWSPLVAIAGQKQITLYNTDTLDMLGVLPFPEGTPTVLKFSRNGSLLLAGGGRGGKSGRVVVWSVATGERLFEVGEESDAVLAADISPDQTLIALGGPSKVIRIYSTKDGKLLHEVKKHTDWVTTLEFSPDGVLLATGDRNGGLIVWESHGLREFHTLRGHTASITEVAWRPDGNVLASTSEDTTVRLWEMENGNPIKNWGAHGGGAQSVRFLKDGRLVSAGRDRIVKLWDGNGAQQRVFEAFPDIALRTTTTHNDARVIGSDWTGLVRVFEQADGKVVGVLQPNPPNPAEQLTLAAKDLVTAAAARDAASATWKASQAALDKANAELAAAQKAVTDTAAAAKAAVENVPKLKTAMDTATANLGTANADVNAKDLLVKSLTTASATVIDAATKAPADKALAAAAEKARGFVAQATAELTAAKTAVTTMTAALKTATDQHTAGVALVPTTDAAMKAAPAQVPPRQAAQQAAATKAAADKAALDAAQAAVKAAADRVEKWKAILAAQQTAAPL